jgi:hypothetical protein
MSACVYSVFVLSCVQVAALLRADPPIPRPRRFTDRVKDQETEKAAKVYKGCRAIDRQTDRQTDRKIDR